MCLFCYDVIIFEVDYTCRLFFNGFDCILNFLFKMCIWSWIFIIQFWIYIKYFSIRRFSINNAIDIPFDKKKRSRITIFPGRFKQTWPRGKMRKSLNYKITIQLTYSRLYGTAWYLQKKKKEIKIHKISLYTHFFLDIFFALSLQLFLFYSLKLHWHYITDTCSMFSAHVPSEIENHIYCSSNHRKHYFFFTSYEPL